MFSRENKRTKCLPELQLPSTSCCRGTPSFCVAHRVVLQSELLANPLSQHPCNWVDGIP